jgi:hypothetical protein
MSRAQEDPRNKTHAYDHMDAVQGGAGEVEEKNKARAALSGPRNLEVWCGREKVFLIMHFPQSRNAW